MKKTVISTIVLGAAGLALAGCGGSADATDQSDGPDLTTAYTACVQHSSERYMKRWITQPDSHTITASSLRVDNVDMEAVTCLFTTLDAGPAFRNKFGGTNAASGTQTAVEAGVTYTWSVNVDDSNQALCTAYYCPDPAQMLTLTIEG
jgi:hypothetical protein